MTIRVPRYQPSRSIKRFQQRLVMIILVAMLGMVGGIISFPTARTWYYLHQLHYGSRGEKIAALNRLSPLAVSNEELHEDIEAALVELLAGASLPEENVLVQIGQWLARNMPAMVAGLEARLDSASDELFGDLVVILQEAPTWRMEEQPPARRARQLLIRSRSDVPRVRVEALRQMQTIGPVLEPWITERVVELLSDSNPEVRLAAVATASICLPHSRKEVLQQATRDEDPGVGEEATARSELLDRIIQNVTVNNKSAGAEAPGSEEGGTGSSDLQTKNNLEQLRQVVREELAEGNPAAAGRSLWELARLGDRESLPLMLEVAEGYADQPLLRWRAARSAALLDSEAGGGALLNLLTSESDMVRDLAAIELAWLDQPEIVRRLKSEFFAVERPARGAAALALALAGKGDEILKDGLTLRQWLAERTRLLTDNPHAEPDWLPRGYYLCSRLALGEEVRGELEVFLINEHFPRPAIYTAMLHGGDSTPIDLILEMTPQEQEYLLRDCFFGEIVQRYLPQAPVPNWADLPMLRPRDIKTFDRWWSIYRWSLIFDPVSHQWMGNSAAPPVG